MSDLKRLLDLLNGKPIVTDSPMVFIPLNQLLPYKISALYTRYGKALKEDCDSLEGAKEFLNDLEESGEAFALGIYTSFDKSMHIPNNMDISGKSEQDILEDKLAIFKGDGFDIVTINFYER